MKRPDPPGIDHKCSIISLMQIMLDARCASPPAKHLRPAPRQILPAWRSFARGSPRRRLRRLGQPRMNQTRNSRFGTRIGSGIQQALKVARGTGRGRGPSAAPSGTHRRTGCEVSPADPRPTRDREIATVADADNPWRERAEYRTRCGPLGSPPISGSGSTCGPMSKIDTVTPMNDATGGGRHRPRLRSRYRGTPSTWRRKSSSVPSRMHRRPMIESEL